MDVAPRVVLQDVASEDVNIVTEQSIDEAENVLDDGDKGRSKYVVDGMVLDILPSVVIEDNVDTWRERDGGVRALSKDERGALELLRKVMVDGKWEKVPNMRAVPRKKLMRGRDGRWFDAQCASGRDGCN